MDNIYILHIGEENWSGKYKLPSYAQLLSVADLSQIPEGFGNPEKKLPGVSSKRLAKLALRPKKKRLPKFDLIFVDRELTEEECSYLYKLADAYRLFVWDAIEPKGHFKRLTLRMMARAYSKDTVEKFLQTQLRFYYRKPYGEKYRHTNLAVSPVYQGDMEWEGNYSVTLNGEFGKNYQQIFTYKNTIPIMENQSIDLWLEYEKAGNVDVRMKVVRFPAGATGVENLISEEFYEVDMQNVTRIDADEACNISVSIDVKGEGMFRLIDLHDRHSRGRHGFFLPGGKRYVTSKREELFVYFDPGDMKPPLNVYFSGYKTAQGFEGFNIMKRMGSPFLLIAEARLEGGNFYMGSEDFEDMLSGVITDHLAKLRFTRNDLILSGLSMGTTGALYYGAKLMPHAVIVGKPLASLGEIAERERLYRPGGFPTSLDILLYQTDGQRAEHIAQLNDKFWTLFDRADFGQTKFVIAYMKDDDYDQTAYDKILSHLSQGGVQVYGMGLPGRHNDNTGGIVKWFMAQYNQVMEYDFNRRKQRKKQ